MKEKREPMIIVSTKLQTSKACWETAKAYALGLNTQKRGFANER